MKTGSSISWEEPATQSTVRIEVRYRTLLGFEGPMTYSHSMSLVPGQTHRLALSFGLFSVAFKELDQAAWDASCAGYTPAKVTSP